MNNDIIEIRTLTKEDSEAIIGLLNELGYDMNPKDLLIQLNIILRDANHAAFGAVKNHRLVGFIHSFYTVGLTSLPFTEIKALVVSTNERGHGIGKLLVQKIESTCSHGKLRVRCNTKRELAHNFYYNLHFNLSKEQKVFEKSI